MKKWRSLERLKPPKFMRLNGGAEAPVPWKAETK